MIDMIETIESTVTLIVPVRNEGATIRPFVESLLRQSVRPVEIVIADGGSADDTREQIRALVAGGAPIRLVEDADALPGRGRNIAIRAAETEWVAMTDAGTLVDRDWLRHLVQALKSAEAPDAVFGTYEPLTETFFAKCLALAFVPPATRIAGEDVRGPSTASMMIRKPVWEALGGFPEDLRACEDLLFFERFWKGRYAAASAPEAVVRWSIPGDLRAVFRRFRTYSFHTLKAGLWKTWHYAVLRMYAAAACAVVLAALVHWAFLVVLPLVLLLRAHRSIRLRGPWLKLGRPAGPGTYLAVAGFVLWIDLAMFAGLVLYMLRRRKPDA
jgi:glycosyltransferase involved in cell wall biosynthesis